MDQEGTRLSRCLNTKMLDALLAHLFYLWAWLGQTWLAPGINEVGRFLGTHLISGMVPAFFIAGAITVFLDKQKITKYMGPDANPFVSYPMAAFSGGVLTVCSCGVIPIFAVILHQGAGIGPAFTFLMASPAINLISLVYTQTLLGWPYTLGRATFVAIGAILTGMGMRFLFREEKKAPAAVIMMEPDDEKGIGPIALLFFFLVLIMLVSTGIFDFLLVSDSASVSDSPLLSARTIRSLELLLSKMLLILTLVFFTGVVLYRWFERDEVVQWLRKSKSLFLMIFPKVLVGIFLSGVLSSVLPLVSFVEYFSQNTIAANLLASVIGGMMYFGTIVGVHIVSTLNHFGMNNGPAMALLLSAPAVSLPSVLAMYPVVGAAKALAFLTLVILTSAMSGLIFGFYLPGN